MILASKKTIKEILNKYYVKPSRKLGQNFLINKEVLRKFINACNFKNTDIVLEIGPGVGTLTEKIAKRVKRVIAVEKDSKMCEILKEMMEGFKNVEIIQGDILKIDLNLPKNYKLVGNLPFYITSPIIRKFLEAKEQPEFIIFTQKEVAQRICANPPNMSLLAVSAQFFGEPKVISFVSKKNFWPEPKVDSAIIRIIPRRVKTKKDNLFFKIVRAGFSYPRKQLINNLSLKLKMDREKVKSWLLENNIQSTQRAETLKVEDWINLKKSLKYIND